MGILTTIKQGIRAVLHREGRLVFLWSEFQVRMNDDFVTKPIFVRINDINMIRARDRDMKKDSFDVHGEHSS